MGECVDKIIETTQLLPLTWIEWVNEWVPIKLSLRLSACLFAFCWHTKCVWYADKCATVNFVALLRCCVHSAFCSLLTSADMAWCAAESRLECEWVSEWVSDGRTDGKLYLYHWFGLAWFALVIVCFPLLFRLLWRALVCSAVSFSTKSVSKPSLVAAAVSTRRDATRRDTTRHETRRDETPTSKLILALTHARSHCAYLSYALGCTERLEQHKSSQQRLAWTHCTSQCF